MKPESQIAILKTIVKWQAEEIEALERRLEVLENGQRPILIGSIQGDTETLTVTVPPTWEDADESTAIA